MHRRFDEEHKSMLKDTVKYLSEAFDEKRKYLRKNNVPIIAVNAVVAQYYSIAASDFGEFIDSFFEDVPEDYKLASGASNIKIHKVIPRLLALYKSMCEYFDELEYGNYLPFNSEFITLDEAEDMVEALREDVEEEYEEEADEPDEAEGQDEVSVDSKDDMTDDNSEYDNDSDENY